jgi:splicing factor 3B subunit 1
MSRPDLPVRLVDPFTAPKDVLHEFADLAEEENVNPFAKMQSQHQIASRQPEYHNRKFSHVAQESADAFKPTEDGKEVENVYKDVMRLAWLERR